MPITYHFRNRTPDSVDDFLSSPPDDLVDDSIVLSDLVRAGETSRLRRRGAMRIEPNGSSSTRHYRWGSSSERTAPNADSRGPWTVTENRSRHNSRHFPMLEVSDDDYELEDSDSDSGDEMVFFPSLNGGVSERTSRQHQNDSESSSNRNSMEVERRQTLPEKTTTSYTLVCGGPVDDMAICARSSSESVYPALASFILPQTPYSESSSSRRTSFGNDSSGCGAVIHTRTFPRYHRHQPMWTANTAATDAVVPLEAMYFDEVCAKEKLSTKMMKLESCGCLRIGVGCSNCGNPLGFQLTPCKALKDYLLSRQSRPHHRPPRTPSKISNGEQQLSLYTFFCSSTMSPQTSTFPLAVPPTQRRPDYYRPRTFTDGLLLPPPPPLIRLSDEELSDEESEVVVDFRAPSSSTPSRLLDDGDFTSSPEPQVIRLEPNPTPGHSFSRSNTPDFLSMRSPILPSGDEDSELGQVRASWANVVRGVEAAASSLGGMNGQPIQPSNINPQARRPRGPARRDALGLDPEGDLGLSPATSTSQTGVELPNPNPHDTSSILEEAATLVLTPPPPQPHELPPSTLETTDADANTPRQTIWGMSFADGLPSTSYWGRPAEGSEWTWTNELAGYDDRERVREGAPRRVFDPDGEFLEGLEGEWGEEMARELGFSGPTEEKSESGDTQTGTNGRWWYGW